jgi:hypothetical protein
VSTHSQRLVDVTIHRAESTTNGFSVEQQIVPSLPVAALVGLVPLLPVQDDVAASRSNVDQTHSAPKVTPALYRGG